MCRIKETKVTKPAVPGGGTTPRRRGRPAIDWTQTRKRRLLRLYLCTPESELSLKKILEILTEGAFQPKPRHTQCLLNDMLSKSYRQKRPKNRSSMVERLAYLRSIRDGKPQTNQQPTPRPEVVKECAILLKSNPGGRRAAPLGRDAPGELEDLDSASSPASNASLKSPEMIEPPTPLGSETAEVEEVSPEIFKYPWSAHENGRRQDEMEFLRERCPSRSSSFLAEVADLLDGLSIRSSRSRSNSTGSSCGSVCSVALEAEVASASVFHGDWDVASPPMSLTESVGRDYYTWPGDLDMPAVPLDMAPTSTTSWASSQMTHNATGSDPCHHHHHHHHHHHQIGTTSHTRENQELVRFCCSKTSWCIHQRINAVLVHSRPAETFDCTPAEANSRDGLGNTALHVAARWGAPAPVLFRIMAACAHVGATNHRGETFLHVLDPSGLAPRDLSGMIKHLSGGRGGFGFTQLDEAGQSFVDRLMAGPSFPLESLEDVFSRLPEPDRLALIHHSPRGPHHLLGAIRLRLLAQMPAAASTNGFPQTEEDIASYCEYFVARYGTPHTPSR
ncbi:hypothetical protein VTK26DRAFT_6821 [Humicola hyalothermophila]